jgi:endonuclease/exonuclease/phosphatase family metal-dependent hydrolase
VKKLGISFSGAVLLFYTVVRSPAPSAQIVPDGPGISVVTLNLAKVTATGRILSEIGAYPAVRNADILLFQEVKQDDGQRQCVAEEIAEKLGLHVVYSPSHTGITDQGLAILSRYPLRDKSVMPLKRYDLRFRSRYRIALSVTADSPWGPVRITNTHLDTRVSVDERLRQLAPVIREGAGFSGPRIVGGDFNTHNFRYVARLLPVPGFRSHAEFVRDYMTMSGFRTAPPPSETTFDFLGQRLDWIWMQGLEDRASAVYPLAFSDHHAVWTRVVPAATVARQSARSPEWTPR